MKPVGLGLAALALCLLARPASAAEANVELRVYPAGAIVSVAALLARGPQTEFGVSALYNRAERGSAGKHDDESGDGFGFGVEARHFHQAAHTGWFYGARAELFKLDIDWRDPGNRTGRSTITVLQPTARLGYHFAGSAIELAGNLGAEINLKTKGESVGEGAIALLGVAIAIH